MPGAVEEWSYHRFERMPRKEALSTQFGNLGQKTTSILGQGEEQHGLGQSRCPGFFKFNLIFMEFYILVYFNVFVYFNPPIIFTLNETVQESLQF